MADKAYLDKDGLAEVWSAVEDQVAEASEEIIKVKTVSGDIVSMDDASAYPFLDIAADINPIQDLHGYTKPWAGGNGKNKLLTTVDNIKATNTGHSWVGNKATLNGITFEILTDNDGNVIGIKVSGTATAQTAFNIYSTDSETCPFNGYILSGCPSGGSNTTYDFRISDKDVRGQQEHGDGVTISLTSTGKWCCGIMIRSGYTANNLIFRPMIRASSENADFEPYSNICPISGWTEEKIANMSDISKRQFFNGLLDGTYGFVDLGTLEWIYNSSLLRFDGLIADIKIQSQRTLPLLCPLYTAITDGAQFDENWNMVIYNNHNNARILVHNHSYTDEASFKTAMSGVYLIYPLATPTTPTITEAQFNMLLEQFGIDGKLYIINLNGTRYGGTIDVTRGVMNVTKAVVTENDFIHEGTSGGGLQYFNVPSTYPDAKTTGPLSNMLEYKSGGWGSTTDCFSLHQGNVPSVYPVRVYAKVGASIEAFRARFEGLQVVYELANPIEIQLTPTQIEALLGTNNVWANTGDISVKYAKMGEDMYDLAAANKLYVEQLVEEKDSKFSPVGFSGELVSFEANQEYPLLDLNVDINPVQDLHGYSKPWAPGNGKNLIPMTLDGIKELNTAGTWSGNAYTYGGITYTVQTDSDGNVVSIKAKGNAPAQDTRFNLGTISFTSGTSYKISSGTAGSRTNTYRIWTISEVAFPLGHRLTTDQALGENVARDARGDETCSIALQIMAGYAPSNVVVYPMVYLGSITDTSFEPYSNECPITGWDEVNIPRTGKNLFDIDAAIKGYSINAQGVITVTSEFMYSDMIHVKSGDIYTISFNLNTSIDSRNTRFHAYDKDGNWIKQISFINTGNLGRTSYSFSIPDNTYYMRISIWQGFNTIQIERGLMATDYESYNGNTFTIDLGETRYGCRLNVPSGVMTVTQAVLNLGTLNWTKHSSGCMVSSAVSGAVSAAYGTPNNIICSIYEEMPTRVYTDQFQDKRIGFGVNNTQIIVKDLAYTDAALFTQMLTDTNAQLIYELATPVEIQLDPTEITTLLGTNYIWADTGDIEGQYAQLTDDFKDLSMADRRAMSILIEQKLREHGLIS